MQVVSSSKHQSFKRLVSENTLRADIESRLRESGIHVIETDEELNKDARLPTLDLRLAAVRWSAQVGGEPLGYTIAVRLALNQAAWAGVSDTVGAPVFGDTWARDSLVNYRTAALRKGALGELVGRMTKVFVNDWVATHKK